MEEAQVQTAWEGSFVEASVVSVDAQHVVVELEGAGRGVVPLNDFGARGPNVGVGDRFRVYVEQSLDGDRWLVSKDKSDRWADLERVEAAYDAQQMVEGEIVSTTQGGYVVDIGVKAFVPASQVSLRPLHNPDEMLGQRLSFKIVKFNRGRQNIVLSRRVMLEGERDRALDRLKVGAILDGTVSHFADFGAFVDVGGMEGLLHISDMSWGRIKHPSEAVKIGQALKVKVLRFDKKNRKLSLGLRQVQDDPWLEVSTKYPVGTEVSGQVVSRTDYGLFIEVQPGVEGLVLSKGPVVTDRAKELLRKVDIGDDLAAVVVDLDTTQKRLSLVVKE